jgi:preprotein translocase subunit SecD
MICRAMSFCSCLFLEAALPPKMEAMVGVLVGRASVLARILPLAVVSFVILPARPLPVFFAESFVQALALAHGVLHAFVNGTWTIYELGIVGIVATLSVSVDDVD